MFFFFFFFSDCGALPHISQHCWMIINIIAALHWIRSWQLWSFQKNRQIGSVCARTHVRAFPDITNAGERKRKGASSLDSDLWHPLLDHQIPSITNKKTFNLNLIFCFTNAYGKKERDLFLRLDVRFIYFNVKRRSLLLGFVIAL